MVKDKVAEAEWRYFDESCGIRDSMFKVIKSFISRGCLNPVISTGRTSVW